MSNATFCDQQKFNHLEEICQKQPSSKFLDNGNCYDSSTKALIVINRTTSAEEYWENYVLGHVGYSWENYVKN